MSSNDRRVAHDHFVYLLNKDEFENLPAWIADNFNVIEGGTHAGGSSRNKLIIFKDGTYLELFNWISDPVEFFAWSEKPAGLTDFALTNLPPTTAQQNFIAISKALQSGGDSYLGVSYDQPRGGGRKRSDGADVKWETTRPMTITAKNTPDSSFFPTTRLDVPFFCDDITERSVRVPFEDNAVTSHPCGATGISDVEIVVPQSHLEHYTSLYKAILGISANHANSETQAGRATFNVPAPNPQGQPSTISIVAVPSTAQDQTGSTNHDWITTRGVGIRSLTLAVPAGQKVSAVGHGLDAQTGYAGSVFLVGNA